MGVVVRELDALTSPSSDFGLGNLETSAIQVLKFSAGFTDTVSHFEGFGASRKDSVPLFLVERIFFFFSFFLTSGNY